MSNNLNKNLNSGKQSAPDGVNPQVLNRLLSMASKKLGCTPDQLREQLESGQLEQSIKNSNPTDPSMAKFKQMISDPKAAEKLMKDPNAAEILKKLNK